MTTAVTQALILGARTVVCASTGNTAASLAAYAARAKLQCAILVPRGQISQAKLAQSLDYGAAVLELDGKFDDAMRVISELAEDESIYLVNSINPFRIEGQKTVAAELLHQRGWRVPDHVVMPGGNLGNSSALGKGFKVGVALSGSGPSVIALARDHLPEIGEAIANNFRSRGMPATVCLLDVDREGWKASVAKL